NKHGLEPKSGGGTVWILARELDGQLTVTVADDGQGMAASSTGTGIGLKNLRERLRLSCGPDAALALVSNFPSGMAATITLPCQHADPLLAPPPVPAATAAQGIPEVPHAS